MHKKLAHATNGSRIRCQDFPNTEKLLFFVVVNSVFQAGFTVTQKEWFGMYTPGTSQTKRLVLIYLSTIYQILP